MLEIQENKLIFIFHEGWKAKKYDTWSFYTNQFQKVCNICRCIETKGIKAIDIIAYNNNTAWLIEVKDYRYNKRTKPTDLADEIAKKVFDTLSGLVAAKFNANDNDEKNMAKQFLNKRYLRVVLHLEQPASPSKIKPKIIDPADIKMKLKKQIKAIDPHPKILDMNSTDPATYWEVYNREG